MRLFSYLKTAVLKANYFIWGSNSLESRIERCFKKSEPIDSFPLNPKLRMDNLAFNTLLRDNFWILDDDEPKIQLFRLSLKRNCTFIDILTFLRNEITDFDALAQKEKESITNDLETLIAMTNRKVEELKAKQTLKCE
jgi:hypothetical protein